MTSDTAPATSLGPERVGVADRPPALETVPRPPHSPTAYSSRFFRGWYPSVAELASAPRAMRDLASFTDCSAVLGASAPDPRTVVQAMDEALQWRALRERTEQWDAYVRSQDGAAWQTAFTLLDDLKARFVLAAKSEPMLKVQYPALAAMFDAPKEKAQRSAATRKKRQKAADAEEAAKAAAKTGETPPAPPPTVQVQVT